MQRFLALANIDIPHVLVNMRLWQGQA